MYFTGTNPQNLRMHLLNSELNDAVLLAVYYKVRQRLDVYVNNVYLQPLNVVYKNNQQTFNEVEIIFLVIQKYLV